MSHSSELAIATMNGEHDMKLWIREKMKTLADSVEQLKLRIVENDEFVKRAQSFIAVAAQYDVRIPWNLDADIDIARGVRNEDKRALRTIRLKQRVLVIVQKMMYENRVFEQK